MTGVGEGLAWLHPELADLRARLHALAASHPDAPTLLVADEGVRALPLAPRAERTGTWLLPLRGEAHAVCARETVARAPEAFRANPPLPFFHGDGDRGERTTRLHPFWRGLLPGDVYGAAARDALRELVRLLFPERALLFRTLEHYAVAGLDGATLAAVPRSTPRPSPRARVVAFEGIDGSGKSTHLAALRESVERSGRSCAQLKIFRHGLFHETVTDLARRCIGGRDLHLWRLERMIKVQDSLKYFHAEAEPVLAHHDLVLFDRYVSTHEAAATGRLLHDCSARALLEVYPRPDRVYLLDLPAEDALERIGRRAERTIDENLFMLDRYRRRLAALAERDGFVVLDARAPFEENHGRIRADLWRTVLGEDA